MEKSELYRSEKRRVAALEAAAVAVAYEISDPGYVLEIAADFDAWLRTGRR